METLWAGRILTPERPIATMCYWIGLAGPFPALHCPVLSCTALSCPDLSYSAQPYALPALHCLAFHCLPCTVLPCPAPRSITHHSPAPSASSWHIPTIHTLPPFDVPYDLPLPCSSPYRLLDHSPSLQLFLKHESFCAASEYVNCLACCALHPARGMNQS